MTSKEYKHTGRIHVPTKRKHAECSSSFSLQVHKEAAAVLTIEHVCNDIIFKIALDHLELADLVSLALANKALMARLERYWPRLSTPAYKAQRLDFLQRLDSPQMRDWYLCRACCKYYKWIKDAPRNSPPQDYPPEASRGFSKVWPISPVLDPVRQQWAETGFVPSWKFQLVQRARHYQDLAYGLPASALEQRYSFRGFWDIRTRASFDDNGNLIVRTRTTADATRMTVLTNNGPYVTVGACVCLDSSIQPAVKASYRFMKDSLAHGVQDDFVDNAWDHLVSQWRFHHCDTCLAVVCTRLLYVPPSPVYSDADATRGLLQTASTILVETLRYHNFGPPSQHNKEPRNHGFGLALAPSCEAIGAAWTKLMSTIMS